MFIYLENINYKAIHIIFLTKSNILESGTNKKLYYKYIFLQIKLNSIKTCNCKRLDIDKDLYINFGIVFNFDCRISTVHKLELSYKYYVISYCPGVFSTNQYKIL